LEKISKVEEVFKINALHEFQQQNTILSPGETIDELMYHHKISLEELSERLGVTMIDLANLMNGNRPITDQLAARLEDIFNVEKQYWVNLEKIYSSEIVRYENF
jgi:addiction module HigA family antidote